MLATAELARAPSAPSGLYRTDGSVQPPNFVARSQGTGAYRPPYGFATFSLVLNGPKISMTNLAFYSSGKLEFHGKVAPITAGSGLGFSAAKLLAGLGAVVGVLAKVADQLLPP